jgi:hypothetical protein
MVSLNFHFRHFRSVIGSCDYCPLKGRTSVKVKKGLNRYLFIPLQSILDKKCIKYVVDISYIFLVGVCDLTTHFYEIEAGRSTYRGSRGMGIPGEFRGVQICPWSRSVDAQKSMENPVMSTAHEILTDSRLFIPGAFRGIGGLASMSTGVIRSSYCTVEDSRDMKRCQGYLGKQMVRKTHLSTDAQNN